MRLLLASALALSALLSTAALADAKRAPLHLLERIRRRQPHSHSRAGIELFTFPRSRQRLHALSAANISPGRGKRRTLAPDSFTGFSWALLSAHGMN
jgi:hypothetical protein